MNYDLAMMALEGLSISPITIDVKGKVIELRGEPAGYKELARLLLLISGEGVDRTEEIELTPGVHLGEGSHSVRIRLF